MNVTMNNLSKYHYGFREYDPEIGRWNRVDPLYYQTPGQSPYNFVYNNPVNQYDVAGLFTNDIQFIWHLEWTLNWSAEYQMGVTGDFAVDGGGVRAFGDGQGTVIVSGKDFSASFNGITDAMSREYKEASIRALTETYYQISVQLIEQYIDFYDNLLTSQAIQIIDDPGDQLSKINFHINFDDDWDWANEKFALEILNLVGKPYKLGGNGPESYDCSGAVCHGLRITINPNFGDYTADQLFHLYSQPSNYVSRGNIFFYDYTNDGIIDHVTTIIDQYNMVHPSQQNRIIELRPHTWLNRYTFRRGGVIYLRSWNWKKILGN
ncbi:RHS repeat-associated core domain-containing protein [Caldithrix abyssi DSM 13497]|uniref:RHS repeat-associated core domain-containing protein n=2 Tax=Caldithrix abyssi DSM 13497 TaxID=880073 RepID=H1XVW9_CALAY|nr:RHS repeat-associated core domain-containing protein [Caldithrix abyssi]EHO40696.1 RHS repeat-associated core domain-containing protein [Caldithrix abyssi DSM 13497]